MTIAGRAVIGALSLVAPVLAMAGIDAAGGGRTRLTSDLSTMQVPAGAPVPGEIALGRRLFFEPRLSANDRISCASCHKPEHGFADVERFSVGVSGKPAPRHTPHLFNLAWAPALFWDGRATSLEEQVLGPLGNSDEMALPAAEAVTKLRGFADYVAEFRRVYPRDGLTVRTMARAIATFERSLIAADSPFDRFEAGDSNALAADAIRGRELFYGRARCGTCHSGPDLTDGKFHNTAVPGTDPGRSAFERVGEFRDRPYPFFQMQRAFKTPGLRNVGLTAPYFHDGSEPTLEGVVRFYNQGGKQRDGAVSPDVRPLQLSETSIGDLVAFLGSLTSPAGVTATAQPEARGSRQ